MRWDVSTFEYADKYLNISITDMSLGTLSDVHISPCGSYAFISVHKHETTQKSYILKFNLSTNFEINTGSYSQYLEVTSRDENPSDVFFKPDGTKMFFSGSENAKIYQYNLSTAWDLSTATYYEDFSVSSQELAPNALRFNSDGTKMYMLGGNEATIFQYSLSTAWDLGYASYASKSLDVSGVEDYCTGMAFKNDGSRLYILGFNADKVYQYDLSTDWDVSTGSRADGYYGFVTYGVNPTGLDFRAYGDRFWVTPVGDSKVFQYECPTFIPRVRIL